MARSIWGRESDEPVKRNDCFCHPDRVADATDDGLFDVGGLFVDVGSNHVVARGINETVPFEALSFWRWIVAICLLLPFCFKYLRRDLKIMADHKLSMFLIGFTGVFLFSVVIYLAAYNTTAVNTGLLNATTPIWVLLFAALLTADKPRLGQWLGVLVAGAGTATIIAKGDPSVFARMDFVLGDVLAMMSAMVWAAYSMFLKRAPKGVHPLSLVFVSALIGLCFLTPLYVWALVVDGKPFFTSLDPVWPDMLKIFYIGAGPAFLGYMFWNRGCRWWGRPRRACSCI